MNSLLNALTAWLSSSQFAQSSVVSKREKLKACFLIFLIAIFFSPPPLEKLTSDYAINERWKAFSEQINGTYRSTDYPVESHESKLTFRIVPQIIGKLSFSNDTQTQMIFLYIVQVVFGFLTIFVLLQKMHQLTGDWLYSRITIAGLMLTHFGSSFFYDVTFFLDGFPFFILILAMFTRSNILVTLLLMVSFWCDERALASGLSVVIFRNYTSNKGVTYRNFLLSVNTACYLISVALYFVLRFWMIQTYAVTIPLGDDAGVGLGAIWAQRNQLAIAQMLTFESYWLYILPALLFFYKQNKLLAASILLYLIVYVGVTGMVMDVMRSITYIFPIVILGMVIYVKSEKPETVTKTSTLFTLANAVIPNYRYFEYFYIVLPLPLKIIDLFVGTLG
jgi:hypothetical protein